MFSAYFGSYLLNRELVSSAQLADALEYQKTVRLKLGVLAVNAGFMTPEQVREVHRRQLKVDKRFGEIAIDLGHLTAEQVDILLSTQQKGHLKLAQALVNKGYLSLDQVHAALEDYKREYGLSEDRLSKLEEGDMTEAVRTFAKLTDSPQKDLYVDYISLLLRNVLRFVDQNPKVDPCREPGVYNARWLVSQEISGPVNLYTALAADDAVFIKLASRFAGRSFEDADELAQASFAEFLNLHNGIFLVNMSNSGVELEMKPQAVARDQALTGPIRVVPVCFAGGNFDLILADTKPDSRPSGA